MTDTSEQLRQQLQAAQHALAEAQARCDHHDAKHQAAIKELEDNRSALLFMLEDLERESKQIEHAEQEWVATIDAMSDPVFLHDAEFRILRANRAYAEQVGYKFKEFIGQPYWQFFPKHDDPFPGCCHAFQQKEDEKEEEVNGEHGEIFSSRSFAVRDANGVYQYSVHILRDITERKRAGKVLRESETRFRNLVETSSDWIWEVDENDVYTYASPKVLSILGYEAAEIIGKTPFDLMPPAEAKRIADLFTPIAVARKSFAALENTNLHKDGHQVVLETSGVPVSDVEGKFCGYRGIDRDITARKKKETELQITTDRLNEAQRIGKLGFIDWNVLTNEVELSDETLRIYGLAPGKNKLDLEDITTLVHPEDVEYAVQSLRSAIEKGSKHNIEHRIIRADGTVVYVHTPAEIIRDADGKAIRLLGTVQDITERKQAEEGLRLSAQLLDSASDTIFVLDFNCNFVYLNEAAWKTRGYTRDEMMKINLHVLDTPKYEKFIESRMKALLENGHNIFESEQRRKDGSVMPVEINARIIESGGQKLVISVIRDITERKQAEFALQRTNRALLTLSEGNSALIHATDELQLLQTMCRVAVGKGGYRMAWAGYVEQDAERFLRLMTQEGFEEGYLEQALGTYAETGPGQHPTVRAALSGQTQVAQNIALDPHMLPWRAEAEQLGYASCIALPLLENNKCFGVLAIYAAEPDAFDTDEIKLLEEMAADLTFGILTLRIRKAHAQHELRLHESLLETIQACASIVEMRDPYTAGHQRRVAEFGKAIAHEMGLPDEEGQVIYLAGLIHDVGKVNIPSEVLSKPGKLTTIEYAYVQTHAQAGYDLLKTIHFPWPIAKLIWQHHERMDGSGYPQGLKGEQILLGARILAVADVVEAISSHRPYRPGLGIDAALSEIKSKREKIFDPQVVDACLRLFHERDYQLSE